MPTDLEAELSDALEAYAAAVVPHAAAPADNVVPLRPRPRRLVVLAVAAALLAVVGAVALMNRDDGSRVEIQPAEFRETPPYPEITARRLSNRPKEFDDRKHVEDLYFLGEEKGSRLIAYDPTGRGEQVCIEFEKGPFRQGMLPECSDPGSDSLKPLGFTVADPPTALTPGFASSAAKAVAIFDESGVRRAITPAVRIPGLALRVYVFRSDSRTLPFGHTVVSLDAEGNVIETFSAP